MRVWKIVFRLIPLVLFVASITALSWALDTYGIDGRSVLLLMSTALWGVLFVRHA